MISLRLMTMEDADRMLEWKNYPETRQFALASHDEIKREDHLKWLAKNYIYFQVVMLDEEAIGAIRIQDNEISIWIDRAYWGQGIATKVLMLASYTGLKAKIVPENLGSLKAFLKAGYKLMEYVKDTVPYYLLQK